MWAISHPINIITTQGSWYEEYARKLQRGLLSLKFNCNILFTHEKVQENSIAFYLSYQKIVPKKKLEKTFQSLVVHASDLPHGRGFSPWVWQILEGKDIIPLCLFQMEEGLDTGPIFQKGYLKLKGDELLEELRGMLAGLIYQMILEYLTKSEQPESIKQTGLPTFYRRRTTADSELDINKPLIEQFNLLRIVDNNNYPAFFWYKNRKYLLKIEREND